MARPCSPLLAAALVASAPLARASMAWHCSSPPACVDGGCSGMTWQVADSSGFRPRSHLCYGSGQPAHARLRGAGLAAFPCRSGRRAPAAPHRCAAVLLDAAMADALACFSGRTAPNACYSGLSTAGGGSAVLVDARNAGLTLVRMHMCGFDPVSCEIARDCARCMCKCITRLAV